MQYRVVICSFTPSYEFLSLLSYVVKLEWIDKMRDIDEICDEKYKHDIKMVHPCGEVQRSSVAR